eukprot:2941169-Rhodomonas_salina.1
MNSEPFHAPPPNLFAQKKRRSFSFGSCRLQGKRRRERGKKKQEEEKEGAGGWEKGEDGCAWTDGRRETASGHHVLDLCLLGSVFRLSSSYCRNHAPLHYHCRLEADRRVRTMERLIRMHLSCSRQVERECVGSKMRRKSEENESSER